MADDGRVTVDLDSLLATARVFAIPLVERFRGITVREGVLLHGRAGWAEFAPFRDYSDVECVPWLRSAMEAATMPWPEPLRHRIEVNTTIPVVPPERAAGVWSGIGLPHRQGQGGRPSGRSDRRRQKVEAVRDALGVGGRIRVDANGAWTPPQAIGDRGADRGGRGLEYVEQPCRTLPELAEVRRLTGVPIAADESIRRATDPARVVLAGAADIAVIKVAPLGGVRAPRCGSSGRGPAGGVSSAVDGCGGLTAGLVLAAALPELPLACGLGTAGLLADDLTTGVAAGRRIHRGPRARPRPDRYEHVRADPATTRYWLDRLQRVAGLSWNRSDPETGLWALSGRWDAAPMLRA